MDKPAVTLHVRVNLNREVERTVFTVIGEEQEESSENHAVDLRAEVNLIWQPPSAREEYAQPAEKISFKPK